MSEKASALFSLINGNKNIVVQIGSILAAFIIIGIFFKPLYQIPSDVAANVDQIQKHQETISNINDWRQETNLELQKQRSSVRGLNDKMDKLITLQEQIVNINQSLVKLNTNVENMEGAIQEIKDDIKNLRRD